MSARPWLVYAQFGIVWAACLCAAALGITYVISHLSKKVQNIDAQLRIPEEVTLGSDFAVVLHVTNTAAEPQILNLVTLDRGIIERLQILRSEPEFLGIESEESSPVRRYRFNRAIPPNHTLSVAFPAHASRLGTITGDMLLCFNSDFTCLNYFVSIPVVP